MRRTLRPLTGLALLAVVSACASGQPRGPSDRVISRALQTAPGAAQPSTIVATELALAREAREKGQLAASRDFAAANAVLHGRDGPVPFAALADLPDGPASASEWGPRQVVKSCDGSLALSRGRFRDADGFVGNYVTVWERQGNGEYRWTYDVAGRDDPQPPPRAAPEDGDIVVTAMNAVEGLVATCAREMMVEPAPPLSIGSQNAQVSRDGTLRWAWEHRADGIKRVVADYFFEGEWVRAIEEELASPDEG